MSAKPLQPGSIYRDVDGQLVELVGVRDDLCSWAPVTAAEKICQVTHRENFLRRFVRQRVAASQPDGSKGRA